MKAPTMQQESVLLWLFENQPELYAVAEIDRAWVWLPVDLRGCGAHKCECDVCVAKRAVRTAIKEIGFRWAKAGHELPSGATGTWAHHCEKPIPFRRRSDGGKREVHEDRRETTELDTEILAVLGSGK